MKIISGGQTGVDRAALDFALKHHVECGGWCPAGRLDEFGRIPEYYPVRELPAGNFGERTLRNVIDSDGTLIVYSAELDGGTDYTLRCCLQQKRPHLLVDSTLMSARSAGEALDRFVHEHNIKILNVAGPRRSEWPSGYEYAFSALEAFVEIH